MEVVRKEGITALCFRILGETVYRRTVLFERLLCEPISPVSAGLPVVVNLLTETEIEEYCQFRPDAHSSEVRRRPEAGQWCFAARHQGRLVHTASAASQRTWIGYLNREIRLAPGEAYEYEAFTAADFRGQNISPARKVWMLRYLHDAGYRRAVALVVPENEPAFRPVEKAGYRRLGVMGYLKIGPWRHDFCRTRRASFLSER